jgi:hypothetical protein
MADLPAVDAQFTCSVIGAVFNGCVIPAFSIVFSNMISLFGDIMHPDDMKSQSLQYLIAFCGIAAVSFVVSTLNASLMQHYRATAPHCRFMLRCGLLPVYQALFIQMYGATYVGERLTRRLRSDVFDAVMKQEV